MSGGIEQQPGHRSARAARVGLTLSPHPCRRIVVPLVTGIGQAAEGGFDVVPAPLVLETALDELGK